mmetsp:Transcript_1817/g.5092  ORF Transcript_1817/g.5092 Transcript_1817/m.5092 type:complete len:321 (+) Transcript_1817:24-986(+)
MRLTRPNFHLDSQVPHRVAGDALEEVGMSHEVEEDDSDHVAQLALADTFMLPAGFGSIYLGETFNGYVSVANNGSTDLSHVVVKVELQTGSKRSMLLDSSHAPTKTFSARSNLEFLVEHEMKEACVHIMICHASWIDKVNGEEKKSRQYFKFQALKPVSVNTKIHMMLESVFLENQVHNISQTPLFLDSVSFEASGAYNLSDHNDLRSQHLRTPPGPFELVGETFGQATYLRPGDVRQYLYQLRPKSGILDPHDKNAGVLGKLEMRWKSAMAEPGRLHTYVNMVQWKLPPRRDVELALASLPDRVVMEQPFEVMRYLAVS